MDDKIERQYEERQLHTEKQRASSAYSLAIDKTSNKKTD
jgi:hypothetical protein